MSELREIIKHIEEIHKLLLILESKQEGSEEEETNEETEANHKRTRSIFNSSKFLNKDDREKVLEFLDDKVMNDINKLPAHKRCSYTQNLLKDKLKLNVSSYMINRLLAFKNNKE